MTLPAFSPVMSTFSPLGDAWATARREARQAVAAPADWQAWLKVLHPAHIRSPFAQRHVQFWEHIWAIERGSAPRPFVAIWPRGGAKSTSAELAACSLGVRDKRGYCLYVRGTQEQADNSVTNIAALLESDTVSAHYPAHADRLVSKFGTSRGWRRNRLRTAGGYTVDAIGLDTAARGAKVDEERPDLIIFDDLDDKHDSAATTAKKIATLTTSLLPAGANNVAIIAIQNLIIPDGIFSRLVDGRAEYLADRVVSGPYPAVDNIKVEMQEDPDGDDRLPVIVRGKATWAGQNLEDCGRLLKLIGPSAFMKECQHEVLEKREGLALRFDVRRHFADLTHAQLLELVQLGSVFGGVDFGAWRFAFTLWAADRAGVVHRVAEIFSQREGLEARARKMHEICQWLGCPDRFSIWGDAANPQDIIELNAAFKRGWKDAQGKLVTSKLRVWPVAMENKVRKASVERINDLLDRNAFKLVRSVGARDTWMLNWNAGSGGTEMRGSRFLYELQHWAYPVPQEGKAQAQDPDDHTADGADEIASARYALMSWWKAAKTVVEERSAFDPAVLQEDAEHSRRIKHRLTRRANRPVDTHFGGA